MNTKEEIKFLVDYMRKRRATGMDPDLILNKEETIEFMIEVLNHVETKLVEINNHLSKD